MEEGTHWLVDDIDKVQLGDQHHAEAVEQLRNAVGKSWALVIERDNEEDDPDAPIKPHSTLYSSIKRTSDGQPLFRMARYFHAIAERYAQVSANARANYVMHQLMGHDEPEDDPA